MLGNLMGENCRQPQLKLDYTGGTTESVDYFIYESGQVVLQFHENNPTGDLTAGDLVHRYLWNPQQVDQLLADEQVSSLSLARSGRLAAARRSELAHGPGHL